MPTNGARTPSTSSIGTPAPATIAAREPREIVGRVVARADACPRSRCPSRAAGRRSPARARPRRDTPPRSASAPSRPCRRRRRARSRSTPRRISARITARASSSVRVNRTPPGSARSSCARSAPRNRARCRSRSRRLSPRRTIPSTARGLVAADDAPSTCPRPLARGIVARIVEVGALVARPRSARARACGARCRTPRRSPTRTRRRPRSSICAATRPTAAGKTFKLQWEWRPLGKISRYLRAAVIYAEDAHFYTHDGVDWDAIEHAVETDLDQGAKRSAAARSRSSSRRTSTCRRTRSSSARRARC